LVLILVGGLLVVLPPFLSAYPLTLLTQVLIYGVFAMSLDLLLGYTGLPSLGHAAYFGTAAYVVAIFATEYHAGFWTCLVLALIAAILMGALFGFVAIRAAGVYFLMITLALGMVVWGLAFRWVSVTKGDTGISSVPRPSLGLPWAFTNQTAFYYLTLVVFLLAFGLLFLIVHSPFGMSLRGIRESERRMRSLGYNVWLHKYVAFVLAAAFAGLGGVLWGYYNGFVSPTDVQLITSVETLLMVALGGSGTLVGPVLGAGVIVFLKNFVSVYTKRWLLILGGVYIGVILFAPRGILGALSGMARVGTKTGVPAQAEGGTARERRGGFESGSIS
jgi:branched-chain amino acid transport system permease protein